MADQLRQRIAKSIEPLLVKPGSSVVLETDFDPEFKTRVKKKKQGVKLLRAEAPKRAAPDPFADRLAEASDDGVVGAT
jgi:hypothetical protein